MTESNSDKLIKTVSSAEEAEIIRKKILKLTPRPFVFVVVNKLIPDVFEIRISNQWGGQPDDAFYNMVLSKIEPDEQAK